MRKNWRRFWVQHIPWISKILFCFWIEAYFFFFWNGHIRNVVSTLPNVVKIDVENDNVVSTLSNVVQFNVEIHNVVERRKFQRWRTQRCFNVDLTLCDVATSYQPKNNVNRRRNVCWKDMSHQDTRANFILLLEAYHWHKSKTEEVPGRNPEELYKKSFLNQIVCFQFLPKAFGHKGRT